MPRNSSQMNPVDASINHCLESLGFEDRSKEGLNPEIMKTEPELLAVWMPPVGSTWDPPPSSTVTVRRLPDAWTVTFVPPGSRGPEAEYFSRAFSRCISVHDSAITVEIRSERFLDLR